MSAEKECIKSLMERAFKGQKTETTLHEIWDMLEHYRKDTAHLRDLLDRALPRIEAVAESHSLIDGVSRGPDNKHDRLAFLIRRALTPNLELSGGEAVRLE